MAKKRTKKIIKHKPGDVLTMSGPCRVKCLAGRKVEVEAMPRVQIRHRKGKG